MMMMPGGMVYTRYLRINTVSALEGLNHLNIQHMWSFSLSHAGIWMGTTTVQNNVGIRLYLPILKNISDYMLYHTDYNE